VSGGDRQALGAIFERYQQELYRFCLGLLGEPQDAQDALQNTMVKVLRALPGEEREIALRPWLYRIAHNEAIELRRGRRETQTLDGYLPDRLSSVVEKAEQRERLEWALKDLDDLPERQRSVLVMRELSGLDFAEIAAALDTSGAVVRQSLYEARRNLEQMDRGRSLRCEAVAREISDGDGRVAGRREIRAHLRDCSECRHFRDRIKGRKEALAGIAPLPAGAAAGIMHTVFGGGTGGTSAGGLAAVVGGGAAKSIGVPGLLKALATVAVVGAVGTAEVERGSHRQGGAEGAPVVHSGSPSVARDSGVRGKADLPHRLRSPGGDAVVPPAPDLAAVRSEAGASARNLAARRSTAPPAESVARVAGDSVAPPRTPTAEHMPTASGPAVAAMPPTPMGAMVAPKGDPPKADKQSKSTAKAEGGKGGAATAAAVTSEHGAQSAHPVHPEHPAQSQKPAGEGDHSEEGAPEEAATTLAPEMEEPTAESDSAGSNGKAKGKEKKTQG
jgi:RNA polymerase sigma factor (sigma-70 family)